MLLLSVSVFISKNKLSLYHYVLFARKNKIRKLATLLPLLTAYLVNSILLIIFDLKKKKKTNLLKLYHVWGS